MLCVLATRRNYAMHGPIVVPKWTESDTSPVQGLVSLGTVNGGRFAGETAVVFGCFWYDVIEAHVERVSP